jgi:hypothetical protein
MRRYGDGITVETTVAFYLRPNYLNRVPPYHFEKKSD